MNIACSINKAKLALSVLQPRFYGVFSQCTSQHLAQLGNKNVKLLQQNVCCRNLRYISNCNLMQNSNSDPSANNDEKFQNVLDDIEFQSIIKDFAKDFGVNDENNKLLEDIRKNIDGNGCDDDLNKRSAESTDGTFFSKFKEFSDKDSSVIHSYEERYQEPEDTEETYHVEHELNPKRTYKDLKRGVTGVFDLDELVDILQNENLLDIVSIPIPKELHYADFLVLATAKSLRHSEAVGELILKLYKQKKNLTDPFVKIEGERHSNWNAIDMGNIVLHIFLEETRSFYDLESLWLLDAKYDSGGNMEKDPLMDMLEEQVEFFKNLELSQNAEKPKDDS